MDALDRSVIKSVSAKQPPRRRRSERYGRTLAPWLLARVSGSSRLTVDGRLILFHAYGFS
jgi:hypothetical protein